MNSHQSKPTAKGAVIVTGAGRRIGRALVEYLSGVGHPVCLHYFRSDDSAEQVASSLRDRGGQVVTVKADLAQSTEAVQQIFSACTTLGAPQILINNAAIFTAQSLHEVDGPSFDETIAVNLKAPTLLCRQFASAASSGQIINIADWRGLRPIPGHLSYTLSKAGLIALTEMLALELAPRIRVNAIALGAILPAETGADEELDIESRNPLRRAGGITAVVSAVDYLLNTPFVTGETLRLTGGEELAIQRGRE
ncbi:MAG: SDR family NAD(P)-dependent oxidoreductase [Pirellulaceae bacterium]